MIEDPSIIDPVFLLVLTADPHISPYAVRRKLEAYKAYRACGWPVEKMVLASELGYAPRHPGKELGIYNFYFTLDQLRESSLCEFEEWLEDFHCRIGAKAFGLSLTEFVELWLRLQRCSLWINDETGPHGIEARLRWYIRARRSGLDDLETLRAMELCRYDFTSYVFLRRKLSKLYVQEIIEASKRHGISWTLGKKPQDVLKALRRGASIGQVIAHVEKGTLAQLAQRR